MTRLLLAALLMRSLQAQSSAPYAITHTYGSAAPGRGTTSCRIPPTIGSSSLGRRESWSWMRIAERSASW